MLTRRELLGVSYLIIQSVYYMHAPLKERAVYSPLMLSVFQTRVP